MFRLTREVRFAINPSPDEQLAGRPSNSFGGFPALRGFGVHLSLQVTLAAESLEAKSQYVRNIKQVDEAIRREVIPSMRIGRNDPAPAGQVASLFERVSKLFPGSCVDCVRLVLTPTLSVACLASEHPMVRLSQKFEFSASHRLHSPQLSDEENRQTFGKCSNPHGHGHNYELQVTLRGEPDAGGVLIDVPAFERIVSESIIEPFDHKNLNDEVAAFRDGGLIPSVENIAMVIYRTLKPKFGAQRAQLASVTVWETPKTWCEFSE